MTTEDTDIRVGRIYRVLKEYQDGAITYIEFVRFCMSLTTDADCAEFNDARKMYDQWPFNLESK